MSETAFCTKCREKRPMNDAVAGKNRTGGDMVSGTCRVCGTRMVRMGKRKTTE